MSKEENRYTTISILVKIMDEVDEVINELGFWATRAQFVREAVLEKLKREKGYWKEP